MSDLNVLLKLLKKEGYPGPNTLDYMKFLRYDPDDFISDLLYEIGEDKTIKFAKNCLESFYVDGSYRVDLSNHFEKGSWCDVDITNIRIVNNEVVADFNLGDKSHIVLSHEVTDLDKIYLELDMGDMNDFEDLIDHIRHYAAEKIYKYCGFNFWWN